MTNNETRIVTFRTKSKAAFAVVSLERPDGLASWSSTEAGAAKRVAELGEGFVVAPIVDGTVTVEVPA